MYAFDRERTTRSAGKVFSAGIGACAQRAGAIALGCAAIAVGLFGALAPADAQTRAKTKAHVERAVPIYREEVKTTEKVNAWTLGLAAGLPEGAPLRFATSSHALSMMGRNCACCRL